MTLQALLNYSTKKYTDQGALAFVDQEPLSYRQVKTAATGMAARLIELGVAKGDRVALLGENMPFWGVSYFAVALAGAVSVPVLPDFTEEDIKGILRHSGAKAMVISDRMAARLTDLPADIQRIRMEEPLPSDGDGLPADRTVEEDDLSAIIYTSGTTGSPKGVMLSHRNILSNVLAAAPIPRMKPRERLLSILPLSHTYECTIGFLIPFLMGACVYYIKKPPTPTVLKEALQKVRPGVMLSVPLLIEKIYRQNIKPTLNKSPFTRALIRFAPARGLLHRLAGKSLKQFFGGRLYFFGVGGAPLSPDVEKFLRQARFPYAIGYGLTETSPLIAGDNAAFTRFRSTGRVLQGVEVRIDDPDPETGEGEILVRGPNVMLGYYKDEERTAEVFTPDGWFKTGDLGVMNDKGYLYIKGRSKNLILGPSGENVYPESIENLLNSFPYVEDSLVFAYEGTIIARVQLDRESLEKHLESLKTGVREVSDYAKEHLAEIRQTVNRKLSHFSRLNTIMEQPTPFEKTPTKKIKRFLYTKPETPGLEEQTD
ncbi:MAG: AMP-binding protein [Spirochaetales bacterium]|nr:AMP-binding protein [Spirochaetales bacterium]